MKINRIVVGVLLGCALALTSPRTEASGAETINLGVLTDLTGIYSASSGPGAVEAARMAVEDFGGKLMGREIRILAADHQNRPDIGLSILRRWYETENVLAAFEFVNSAVALAAFNLAKDQNKIAVATGAGSSALTGKGCSPNGFHWVYNSYAIANALSSAIVKKGGTTWYFITADYALGHQLEADTTAAVKKAGGKVLGSVRNPSPTQDFSSFLLQAQASGAQIIALANGGQDLVNLVRGADEFQIVEGGQKLGGLITLITDVHALDKKSRAGLLVLESFYWNLNEETRSWSARFYERQKVMPTMIQAGTYSAVLHYLKAAQAAGTVDTQAVIAKMRELPVNDFFVKNGKVREDGLHVHDLYLFRVKAPEESKGEWDLYELVDTVKGEAAYRPIAESDCPYLKN
jgi:branched-chain amino acid transport system substrate-binding protein